MISYSLRLLGNTVYFYETENGLAAQGLRLLHQIPPPILSGQA